VTAQESPSGGLLGGLGGGCAMVFLDTTPWVAWR
jgi:hypothetical protein